MKKSDTGLLSFWAVITMLIIMFIGYVMNIVELFNSSFDVITGELILRIIGVVIAPVGAILGLFV